MLEKLRGKWFVPFWTVLRVWLGIQWLEAGWRKAFGEFDASGFIHGAVAKASGENPTVQAWYAAFLENIVLPNVELINFLVAWGEVAVGFGLILGAFTTIALYAGAFMNLNFLLAGTISVNPILLVAAVALLAMGTTAYAWGVDRFLLPRLQNYFRDVFNRPDHATQ